MKKYYQKAKILLFLCLSIAIIANLTSTTYFGLASPQNKTSMEAGSLNNMTSMNATNIVLVHGALYDGSAWSKVIPILTDTGRKVIAVQLPLHSYGDDVDTVKRAIELLEGPTVLVGHSYGGKVITNAGYNNPNVTGLVYIAAIAPDEGETGNEFFENPPKRFSENSELDSAGFLYFNPDKFRELFAQDVHPNEADIMAVVQKPFNQSIFAEKSGPPAWKQLPTWYQISENDRLVPPDIQRLYAERMNATTLPLNSSHMSLVSQPEEVAELILNATRVNTTH
jgi:pimeloyl-ACP methyl ester carboxylesterase